MMLRFVLVAIVLSASACDDPTLLPGEPSPEASTTESVSSPSVSGPPASSASGGARAVCPNEGAVTSDDAARLTGELSADVDGDGNDDEIALFVDVAGDPGCQAFLAVRSEDQKAATEIWMHGEGGGLPQPSLNGTAELNGLPGAEILVDEASGASTQLMGAFTLIEGDLQRIVTADEDEEPRGGQIDGLFPYGGSVGHLQAVDCLSDGQLVMSLAVPQDDRYKVTRRSFTVDGAELVPAAKETEVVAFEDIETSFPEYSGSPFGRCAS
ncbi:MAG: hypothetical protein M3345_00285 [Actinomycetota bacterium]|nr:hypothetical protein [Actinomycetota bacterium]